MADGFKDAKTAEDFLVKEKAAVDEVASGKEELEKQLEKKVEEEKKEVQKIKKEEKKLEKAEAEIKKEIKKDEAIVLDFSRIKNFFRSGKKAEKARAPAEKAKSSEEAFDLNSVADFIVRYKIVIFILIAIFFAVFIRMQSEQLSFTDKWAVSTADNYYKNQIRTQVDQQYPNLPDANKQAIVDQQFESYSSANKDTINGQIKQLSEQFKGFYRFDSDNRNYMPDIDPYVYLRYAENYINHGYIGDEKSIVNSTEVQIDTHQFGPLGNQINAKQLHPYVLAYLYYVIKIFSPSTTPMDSASYFPVLFAALSVIPAFFIGKKLAGNVGGFFSAFLIAIHPAFIGRSLWGHADTDAYNIFFPLYIVWVFLVAIDQKDRKKQIAYSAVAGIITGIYSLAWNGWWYVFDFIIGMIIIYLIYLFVKEKGFKENTKSLLLIAVVFVIASGIFVSILSPGGISSFVNAPLQPISFSSLKVAAHATLWPNVYTTVAELNPASVSQIVSSVGGSLLFFISLVGIALMFIKREGKLQIHTAALVILWYIGIFYASTKGVRFTMMLVPPFALAFSTALGRIYEGLTKYAEKDMKLNRKITGVVLVVVFLLLLISPFRTSLSTAQGDVPIINDAWFNALNKIKIESAPTAIVNSWWDFGHHFKYYADRAVTFDGGSQNTPMAHWIGKALLTDDEELSVGILRMLDCGENTAFDKLNANVNDVSVSVKMLYDIVKMDKASAKEYLKNAGLSDSEADSVLQYTHCTPPEDYFITSEDMVGKSGVWAHFGSWDFDRADIWVYARNLPQNEAVDFIMKNSNVSRDEAEKLYFEVQGIRDEGEANSWIAPWPSYGGTSSCVNTENKTIKCNNGVMINLTSLDVTVPTQQGNVRPYSLVYETASGRVAEKRFNSSLELSIELLSVQNPQIAISQPVLAASMFTRLFYYRGVGLKHFKLFTHQSGITGTDVYVWKVDWQGTS